eukprot:gnl/TRDRNA2_/TRDRNA2_94188_c0_seq1.p1 gnl/TRDRNA2_/TRDRNA2_94188_c0~~gnl/TRDRNA2_/TRDRNA2_94188_c0_seq1.p1  ORF type:complete len:583 (+),score=94.26 gnl/TRDRNA2_/TRDRNA2_94188_c0_seq1:50-1798(+)
MAAEQMLCSLGGLGVCGACWYVIDALPLLLPRKDPKERPVSTADLHSADKKKVVKLSSPPLASQIVKDCQEGRKSVIATLEDFLARARTCSELTACVVESQQAAVELRARQIAAELDEMSPEARRAKPLFGLPFSVKECYLFKGTDSTCGLSVFVGKPADQDAALVAQMIDLGAVPLVKTNVPQVMYAWECANHLHGVTSHPLHRSFIPGGSSGGEACLMAMGGSVVGIGTDIGGSCRIPAHMAGCCGLKFTKNRMSLRGKSQKYVFGDGQQIVASCSGPLARTVDDLAFMTGALCSPASLKYVSQLDSAVIPLAWDSAAVEGRGAGPLRVGYYVHDGFLEASPACVRAVREAVQALKKAGVQCVEFKPPDVEAGFMTFVALLATGGPHIIEVMRLRQRGERVADALLLLLKSNVLPSWARWIASSVMAAVGAPIMAKFVEVAGQKSGAEYYSHVADTAYYKAKFEKAFAPDLDLLLAPVHVLPAHPHMTSKDISPTCCYSALYNLLDYPAGTVPVTTLRPEDSQWECPIRDSILEPKIRAVYAKSLAAETPFPVGVQLVGRPYKEELVIRGMRELETALRS